MLSLQQCVPSKKGPGFGFQWGHIFSRNVISVRLSLEQK